MASAINLMIADLRFLIVVSKPGVNKNSDVSAAEGDLYCERN